MTPKNEYPAKVNLDRNFRSLHGVTDRGEFVFRQLMSVEMGEMEYTREEELTPGASYRKAGGGGYGLHILTLPKGADMDTLEAGIYRQPDRFPWCAMGKLVQDGGKQRPTAYRDFCVLIRNANAHGGVYAAKLLKWEFRLVGYGGHVFRHAGGIVALSYLRVLDNPVQDILCFPF